MMKKGLLLLIACILLLMSGCGCEHEWIGGTCEEGYVCAKCDAAGPAAPGHTWQEATCELPQTCSICGKTQGAALDHSYGDWILPDIVFVGEEMHRSCERCGNTELGEVDWDFYIQHEIYGYWGERVDVPSLIVLDSKTYNSTYERCRGEVGEVKIRDYLIFNEDQTGTYFDGEVLRDFSWTTLEIETVALQERMVIALNYTDGSTQTLKLDGYGLLYLKGDGRLYKEEDEVFLTHEPMNWLVGTLEFADTDPRQTMEFFPDHTFSWNHPDGEITGNWYPHTESSLYSSDDASATVSCLKIVALEYDLNGQKRISYLEYYMEGASLQQLNEMNEIFLEELNFSLYVTEQTPPVALKRVK